MGLSLPTLCLLCAHTAQAQSSYPGGGYPGGGSGSGGSGGGYPGGSDGTWQVTHTATGSSKLDQYGPNGQQSHTNTEWTPDYIWFYGTMGCEQGWSSSMEGKGTVTYQFDYLDHWGSSVTPPLDHTWIKKTSNAAWSFGVQMFSGDVSFNGNGSDGLGDAQIDGSSGGVHYEKKDISSGSFSVPISIAASVAATSDAGIGGRGFGSMGGGVNVIDCGLPIISSDIESSTQKGGAPNTRARDGSMSVDSVAIYDSVTGVWRGDTTLTASSPFDDALFTWHAKGGSPSPYDLSNNLGIPSRFLSSISLDMGLCPTSQGLPMTTGVGVQVASQTDTSATNQASYTINWHAPYEAYAPGLSQEGKDFFKERFSGVAPGGSGNEEASKEPRPEGRGFHAEGRATPAHTQAP